MDKCSKKVFVYRGSKCVSGGKPWDNSLAIEECRLESDPEDPVAGVLRLCRADVEHIMSPLWNPLGEFLRPGERVLIKPNFVKESHPRDVEGWRYVITDRRVLNSLLYFVTRAVGRAGRVIIGDAPQTDSSFSRIVSQLELDKMIDLYAARGYHVSLCDFRKEEWENRGGVVTSRRALSGDPSGYVRFDLADRSEFIGHQGEGRYYGADYDTDEVNYHHQAGRHEYLIAGSAIDCDVIISVPKLKTHKKAGITVSLKNLVGVNGDKNWLPHHTEGRKSEGGDESPDGSLSHRIERIAVPYVRRTLGAIPFLGNILHRRVRKVGELVFQDTESVVRSGNWWGNDTVWRMCLDLNKIILFGNMDGTFRSDVPSSRKRHLVFVDGLLAGEGNGPMNPDLVSAGVLLFGSAPPNVDAVSAVIMGLDPKKIPIVRNAYECSHFQLVDNSMQDIEVVSNYADWNMPMVAINPAKTLRFRPHFGWEGHIELGLN